MGLPVRMPCRPDSADRVPQRLLQRDQLINMGPVAGERFPPCGLFGPICLFSD